jgi:membrane-associated PAP2 superfamily phosphatase
MNSGAGPIVFYRRYWLPELIVLSALAFLAVILFAITRLDIAAARLFYHPEQADLWPVSGRPLWSLFYRATPWITGSFAVAGVVMIIIGLVRGNAKRLRLYGLFILLCVILGPGLIINAALKDHWGRPRPRQIVEFGGKFDYVRPFIPARTNGKSFPCGDSSVGFLSSAGWWLWRRSHPKRAAASLLAGLTLGTLLGIGRMAAGAHFLSDVVWSALIVYGVVHVLYYYVLRVPAREDSLEVMYPMIESNPRLKMATIAASCLLGAGVIGGGILANPAGKDLTANIRFADYPVSPEKIEVLVDTLDVNIQLIAEPAGEIECRGSIHGFGLPTNEIKSTWEFESEPVPTLRYRVAEKGWFTDIDGVAQLQIPVRNLKTIVVRAKHGDISVRTAGAGLAPDRLPLLDLSTLQGKVERL